MPGAFFGLIGLALPFDPATRRGADKLRAVSPSNRSRFAGGVRNANAMGSGGVLVPGAGLIGVKLAEAGEVHLPPGGALRCDQVFPANHAEGLAFVFHDLAAPPRLLEGKPRRRGLDIEPHFVLKYGAG